MFYSTQNDNRCLYLQDDRERVTTVHQRIEKKWLGSLTIPFSTIYFNGKVKQNGDHNDFFRTMRSLLISCSI